MTRRKRKRRRIGGRRKWRRRDKEWMNVEGMKEIEKRSIICSIQLCYLYL